MLVAYFFEPLCTRSDSDVMLPTTVNTAML